MTERAIRGRSWTCEKCGESGAAFDGCALGECGAMVSRPMSLGGVWPEELRTAMLVIEVAVERGAAQSTLVEQGRITDAFTALKAYMQKARCAMTPEGA